MRVSGRFLYSSVQFVIVFVGMGAVLWTAAGAVCPRYLSALPPAREPVYGGWPAYRDWSSDYTLGTVLAVLYLW